MSTCTFVRRADTSNRLIVVEALHHLQSASVALKRLRSCRPLALIAACHYASAQAMSLRRSSSILRISRTRWIPSTGRGRSSCQPSGPRAVTHLLVPSCSTSRRRSPSQHTSRASSSRVCAC
ncbi:uncharacterized protein SCHCODRAFT_02230374 [Schizophyllum commune H4-8]|uniref:uncharacterized protein n=1 Tax=Schizophyllum commune (strain H4-8 / FGSC 9210) TaxID=578458 RepID=UPI002160E0CE|nr:uncharacterized protein SCHCODRAFT_02230269 [Schizophyllum commune H4-8]XP_050201198.1 uncharacterized protein SCHCODRAFT_02230374 [Schizophyllum commune H4-8]KAI5895391.1 hypothetical protein SCHCODRAFT_02230269 [Schizophyllum commune H4-8]KAI5895395.1 hypothetical protein SCHCODRAFT_02230374 [Schizophyllum commune H4-8]